LNSPAIRVKKSPAEFTVKTKVVTFAAWLGCFFVSGLVALTEVQGQSNLTVRVMAANTTSGNFSSYQEPGIRIFQGLKPDIVAIQEFRYNASASDANLRQLVDTAFGTNFYYYREPYTGNGDIPNGIISRWPISAAGSWNDSAVGNRGFAWARIDLPGTNDLFVVSVHLLTTGATIRAGEAAELSALISTNFPTNAWIIVAGDLNTDSRTEAAMNTFKTFLSDSPVPTDAESGGNDDTNANRNKPYDYVLPNFALTNYLIPVALPSRTFPKGLVFDSRVYTPLSDVAPVQSGDSGVSGMQHMAVIKDFSLPVGVVVTNSPAILTQPQSQTNSIGGLVEFTVAASGTAPLAYQWRFNNANLSGANNSSFTITNAQNTNVGNYTVVITNSAGSVTSAVATLTLTSEPVIHSQPQNLNVAVGENAAFSVTAVGAAPLQYQWRFNSGAISSATNSTFTRTNAQLADAGNYTVVITNASGSVTSSVATLVVNLITPGELVTLAGWDVSALTDFGDSPQPSTTNVANLTVVGLTRGPGVTTSPTAANRAWGGNGFNTTSLENAIAAGDFVTFSLTANAGYTLSISNLNRFDYRRSGTGPASGVLQYQIGAGGFNFVANLDYSTTTSGGASLGAISLAGFPALQSVPAETPVTFRIVNYGGTSAGGTWYIFDVANSAALDFSLTGTLNPIAPPPPASAPILSNASWSGTEFQFLLTGTTGSNYVVQSATNLNAPVWISLRTNAAPFTYVETNFPATQQFYRGMVAP
jgi:endonuclease/exonuclease/phosphatase family metal-dependent hydrolase